MGIFFVHPGYLWGLLALGVPLLVHLLDFRKTRNLDFSTVRFFGEGAIQSNHRRRLRSILLLLVRLLLLATLVILFAQPYRVNNPFGRLHDPRAVFYCWVDPTISMDYREGEFSLHERARSLIDSLRQEVPPEVSIRMYDSEHDTFEEGVDSSSVRHGPSTLRQMLEAFLKNVSSHPHLPVLMMVSDFQDNGADGVPSVLDTFLTRYNDTYPILGISLEPREPWNVAIRDVGYEGASSMWARVAVSGKASKRATLLVTSGTVQTGQQSIDVTPGTSQTVTFPVSRELRDRPARVMLETLDPFPIDNEAFGAPQGQKRSSILVVGDSAETFPLAWAFSVLRDRGWEQPKIIAIDKVRFDDVNDAEVVVLAGVADLPQAITLYAKSRREMKKVFVVSPHMTSPPALALPSGLLNERFAPIEDMNVRRPMLTDTISGLWRGFRGKHDPLAIAQRSINNLPGRSLMAFDNGRPFISSVDDQWGNVWLLLASALHADSTSSLWQSGFYVPLLDRVVQFGLERVASVDDRWVAGMSRKVPPSSEWTVYDESDNVVARWMGSSQAMIDRPGVYRMHSAGSTPRWISVSVDTNETRFVYRTPGIPANLRERVRIVAAGEAVDFIRQVRTGWSVEWLWISLAALILLEGSLAVRTPRSRKSMSC